MKKFFIGILTGIIFSSAVFYLYLYREKDEKLKDVRVTQVSGEKIEHKGFNYKGSNITFGTEAEGKGKIITEIPKTNVPEARYWMQNTNAVAFEFIQTDHRIYGLSYLKRWNNFSIGGGLLLSEEKFEGVKLQAEYWFSL